MSVAPALSFPRGQDVLNHLRRFHAAAREHHVRERGHKPSGHPSGLPLWLPKLTLAVYQVLAEHADKRTGETTITADGIAIELDLGWRNSPAPKKGARGRRTVSRELGRLVRYGLIAREVKANYYKGRPVGSRPHTRLLDPSGARFVPDPTPSNVSRAPRAPAARQCLGAADQERLGGVGGYASEAHSLSDRGSLDPHPLTPSRGELVGAPPPSPAPRAGSTTAAPPPPIERTPLTPSSEAKNPTPNPAPWAGGVTSPATPPAAPSGTFSSAPQAAQRNAEPTRQREHERSQGEATPSPELRVIRACEEHWRTKIQDVGGATRRIRRKLSVLTHAELARGTPTAEASARAVGLVLSAVEGLPADEYYGSRPYAWSVGLLLRDLDRFAAAPRQRRAAGASDGRPKAWRCKARLDWGTDRHGQKTTVPCAHENAPTALACSYCGQTRELTAPPTTASPNPREHRP